MRRLLIYAALFPPIVWLYMCAVNRVSPFHGSWFGFFSSVAVAYVFCIVPALLTGLSYNELKRRGYRSIFTLLVAAITTPLMCWLFIDYHREAMAYAVAGFVAGMCCWAVSRMWREPGAGVVVPAEGIEPPTFGLQNRCSTAELSRPDVRLPARG